MREQEHKLPVYILSGFLGSGKTTLLQQLLTFWKEQGLRPAVIMNEIGDVNLDGLLVQQEVPMAEMLSGCICCSIRADLAGEMAELIMKERPDVIVIEATGAANPMEILDGVAEVALYQKLEIKPMITVVDAPHLLELARSQKGKTFRLMQDQIRCGSILVLNKTDRVSKEEAVELERQIRSWNPYAEILPAIHCQIDLEQVLQMKGQISSHESAFSGSQGKQDAGFKDAGSSLNHERGDWAERNNGYTSNADSHSHGDDPSSHGHSHATHDHVTVYTHYFNGPIHSEQFEQLIRDLPRDIYRGKGVLTFSDTSSRFLFQYAYRESDYMKINPQGDIPDVAVFIGEHFDKQELADKLTALEAREHAAGKQ
ncbi:CobW family GTP-binding protein [Paenibacillus tuaregi]|uniref:CobW family GTP-binding protein n=1 Tax=Paenibacillus tuaregi TaxID=1816681 RepID=UPI00083843B1|nr:GTP-binding protein [Paenibacillus tuaregi]